METVNDLYTRSLALYDEISKTGLPNESKTQDYKARTPYLADILQKELWNTADNTRIFETSFIPKQKIDLPEDFMLVKTLMFNEEVCNNYRIEKDDTECFLYIKETLKGDIRLQYKPFPATIYTIDDNVRLDAITSLGICYGLARYFAMSEQNDFVENICNAKFNEIKNNKVRVPATCEPILDIYKVGGNSWQNQ